MASALSNLGGIRLAGTVVWCNAPRKVVTRERAGGKGAPKQTVENITYYSDLMIMFGQGPLELLKLEANADVILDFTGIGSTGIYDSGAGTAMAQYNKTPVADTNGVIAGTMAGGGGAAFVIYPGNYNQLPDADYQADVGAANAPAFRGRFCIKIKNFNLSKYSGVPAFYATVINPTVNTASKLALHLAERVGIEPGDTNFWPIREATGGWGVSWGEAWGEALSGGPEAYLRGLAEMNRYSPRAALEKVALPHGLEFYESVDGQLTAKYLGGAVAVTIDPNHLGAVEGLELFTEGDVPALIQFQLVDGVQTHREITVNAFDPDNNYESSGQTAYLFTSPDAEGGMSVDLPMTLTADETRRTAERLLYQEQVARETAQASLPPMYSHYDPTTLAQITDEGITHRLRIRKTSGVLPGVVEVEAVRDNAEVYTQTIAGQASAGYPATSATVSVPQATTLLLMDTVTLTDSEDAPIVHVAACPSATDGSWAGCTVMRDKGSGYEAMDAITTAAIIGTAATALGDAPATLWDETNTVDIDLLTSDTLASATEAEVLAGENAALLGNKTDGWEIIQYKNATQPDATNYPKRWRLSGLLRGRRGTDFATALHGTDDYFVVLDGAVRALELDLMERGIARNWKGVTSGQLEANATAQSLTWQASNLKPLSVVNVAGSRDGSNNLTITWTRRTRIGGEWQDLIDVPLSEASEAYEVDVIVSSAVVRTISATTPTASYSAANQTSDGITPGNAVTVRVYQLSARVGRGFVREATI